jgi:hypothetical protein
MTSALLAAHRVLPECRELEVGADMAKYLLLGMGIWCLYHAWRGIAKHRLVEIFDLVSQTAENSLLP